MKRTARVAALALTLLVVLVVPAVLAQPTGQITSPRDMATVRGLVPVEGSATHPQFWKYEVHYGPEPNPGDQWTPIGGSPFSVPVVQGRLGLWDTTLMTDGVYSLRLRVVHTDGNYDEYFVRAVQVANTQPTEVPTPRPTPTPAGPTSTPLPTATIVIAVPTVSSPTPQPTETPLPTAVPSATAVPVNLPFGIEGVGDAACWGAGATVGAFVAVGLLFALKGSLVSAVRWAIRRGRDSAGGYED